MPRRRPPLPTSLAIASLALLPVASASAQSAPPSSNPQQQDRAGLSEAVRRVERDTRGEVLSAERVQYDGRDMHRVKVVDDRGRVRVFMQEPGRRDDGAPPPRGQDRRERQPPTRDDDD